MPLSRFKWPYKTPMTFGYRSISWAGEKLTVRRHRTFGMRYIEDWNINSILWSAKETTATLCMWQLLHRPTFKDRKKIGLRIVTWIELYWSVNQSRKEGEWKWHLPGQYNVLNCWDYQLSSWALRSFKLSLISISLGTSSLPLWPVWLLQSDNQNIMTFTKVSGEYLPSTIYSYHLFTLPTTALESNYFSLLELWASVYALPFFVCHD